MQVVDTNKGGEKNNDKDSDLQRWLDDNDLSELYYYLRNEFSILSVDELLSLKESTNNLWKVVCDYFYNHKQFKFKFVGMQLRLEKALNQYKQNKNKNNENNKNNNHNQGNNNFVLIIDKEEQALFEQLNSLINTLKSQLKTCNIQTVKSNEFTQNIKRDLHEIIEKMAEKIETIVVGMIDESAHKHFDAVNQYSKTLENSISYLNSINLRCKNSLKSSSILEMKDNMEQKTDIMDRKQIIPTIQESLLQTLTAVNKTNKFDLEHFSNYLTRDGFNANISNDVDIPSMIAKGCYIFWDCFLNLMGFMTDIRMDYDQIMDVIEEQLNDLSTKNKNKSNPNKQQKQFITEQKKVIQTLRKNITESNASNENDEKTQRDIVIITGNALNFINEIKHDLKQNDIEIIHETEEPIKLNKDVIDEMRNDVFVVDMLNRVIERAEYKRKVLENLNDEKCIALLVECKEMNLLKLNLLIGPQSCQMAERYEPLSWNAKYFAGSDDINDDDKDNEENQEKKENKYDAKNIFYSMFWNLGIAENEKWEKYAKIIFTDYEKEKQEQEEEQAKSKKQRKWFGWF